MTLLAPQWLLALTVVAALGMLLQIARLLRRRALVRFFGAGVDREPAARRSPWRDGARATALLAGLGLVVLALARPAYDPRPRKVTRTGRDVVFVVDVSRSMLAQDLRPNRLERATSAIRDVLDVVEGDRVGVIAFAGTAAIKCPLTTDYAFARMALDDLSPDSILRGGTAIGSALRTATELLAPEADEDADKGRFRDVFLFTDGEDNQTDPEAAAREAGEKGIRLVTIALGSDSVGAPVPAPETLQGSPVPGNGFVEYQGQRVQSKADPESLRRVAEAGAEGSTFLNVGVGNIELDRVYKKLMKDSQRRKLDDAEAVRYTEAFQLALAGALLLLCLEPLLAIRRRTP